MRIDIRQLEMLTAVAQHGSLTQAAEVIGVTQPAISIQMRKLEEALGIAIFEKSGRSVQLTEAGKVVVEQARRIHRILEDLGESIQQFKGLKRGNLRLAVVSTANYFIPAYLAKFREEHAEVTVNFQVANRTRVLEMLDSNEADLAITGQPPENSDVIARPFKENPLVVIARPDHPLAGRTDLTPQDFAHYPFVTREPGSGTRAVMDRAFRAHGCALNITCVLDSNEAIKQAVQAGLGLAVISQQTTELETAADLLTILPCEFLALQRMWYVVYRNYRRLPPAALEFRNMLLG